ncbi:hypothetical protein NA57DRAFT_71205 [Rhizodiscina lignyota]|uniref:CENP-V/GFA domain-containing protein n=1 Tax=Rhizodiscina lignyota TaxID=1504668 RepID=A0A9P4MC44_9PEZI|nr:hypothetical protein NA57DRAFT_71205 [Rhizodiscina lignyota]
MPTGSCLCKETRISYTGETVFKSICHCLDCRKHAGIGLVYGVQEQNFHIDSGTPKSYAMQSDHDREITTFFCGNCGTSLYRSGGAPQMNGMVGIRAVVLDDPDGTVISSEEGRPMLEVYVERRPVWMPKVEGVAQLNSKYELIEGTMPGLKA